MDDFKLSEEGTEVRTDSISRISSPSLKSSSVDDEVKNLEDNLPFSMVNRTYLKKFKTIA